jgi:hypothetical protein
MERQIFLDHFAADLACWEDLLGSLREEQVFAPATIGAWSVRDVVVHLAFWTHHAAAHLAAIRAGRAPIEAELYGQQPPPVEVAHDDDAINAWFWRRPRT